MGGGAGRFVPQREIRRRLWQEGVGGRGGAGGVAGPSAALLAVKLREASLRMTGIGGKGWRAVRAAHECPTHAMKLHGWGTLALWRFCPHLKGEMWGTRSGRDDGSIQG